MLMKQITVSLSSGIADLSGSDLFRIIRSNFNLHEEYCSPDCLISLCVQTGSVALTFYNRHRKEVRSMAKNRFCKSDPTMLAVLDELDYLVALLKQILSSIEPESTSSVSMNHVLERTERLRTQIVCMYHKDTNWVGLLQTIVCIAQYVARLWESN